MSNKRLPKFYPSFTQVLAKHYPREMVTSVGFFTYSCKVLLASPPVRCLTRGYPSKHSVSSRVPTIMNLPARHTFLFFSFVIHQSCIWLGNMPTIMNLPTAKTQDVLSCSFLLLFVIVAYICVVLLLIYWLGWWLFLWWRWWWTGQQRAAF